MPRITGVDIPNEKPIKTSLTYVYGVGLKLSLKLLHELNIDPNLRANKLTGSQIQAITAKLDTFLTEDDLKKNIHENIQRLKRIGAYRGLRHIAGLPSRGQRTRTNARTRRGKRRTVGALTKEQRSIVGTAKTTKAA